MIGEAQRCGLRTADEITGRYFALANSYGPIHDSRGGLGSYYRYQPRKISAFLAGDAKDDMVTSTLGLRDPQVGADRNEKGLLDKVVVHESVVARIATGTDGYAPIGLPPAYEVIPPRPTAAETTALETTGGDAPAGAGPAAKKQTLLLPDHVRDWLTPDATEAVAAAMEDPWNAVLWRRLTYFLTVIATLLLFTMPGWVGPVAGDLQLALDSRNIFGNLIRLPGELLPAFTQRWVDTWASYSVVFFGLVVAIFGLMTISKRVQLKMRDRAREIWHGCVPRIPPASAATRPKCLDSRRVSGVESFRNSRGYQRAIQLLKWVILPNFVFAPLLAGLMVIATLGVATQATLPWIERGEALCEGGDTQIVGAGVRFDFRTEALCNPAGLQVEAGTDYLITVEVVDEWKDGSHSTTPQGLTAGDIPWLAGYAGMPLRRVIDARYLQPLAAVRVEEGGFVSGLIGSVPVRRLNLQPVEGEPTRYTVEFEAPANGELLMFANDSVLLFDPGYFYANNEGTACVTITLARPPHPVPGVAPGEIRGGGPVCRNAGSAKPSAAAAGPTRPSQPAPRP